MAPGAGGAKQAALNLRWLLIQRGLPRDQWRTFVANTILDAKDRGLADDALEGAVDLPPTAVDEICRTFAVERDHFLTAPLYGLKEGGVFAENVRYLLGTLEHGKKKELAALCKVTQETISRWSSGEQTPEKRHIRPLMVYFSLPVETDLMTEPIFLSRSLVGAFEGKRWLLDTIKRTPASELTLLVEIAKRTLRQHGAD